VCQQRRGPTLNCSARPLAVRGKRQVPHRAGGTPTSRRCAVRIVAELGWDAVTDAPELQKGPLEDRHRELGANFAEFSGWLMPVSYAGTVSEHKATRNAVGLFDVSHLGKALVSGPGAAQLVNSALTNDLGRIGPGKAQYTLCCTESGGVVDDLIAYYVGPDEIFLVPVRLDHCRVPRAVQREMHWVDLFPDRVRGVARLAAMMRRRRW